MTLTATPTLPPPLKWAGGKRWLLPRLKQHWQPHRNKRLVEPFVGGMAVALGLSPERALLNDANAHLIHFYRSLQRGLRIGLPLENDAECYYAHRIRFNALVREGQGESEEAAGLFYYLNRTGFNGLCRFNRKGEFNVPFGAYKTINYLREFHAYKEALAGWTFRQGDFAALELGPDDLIYADPPYDVPFTSYAAGGFSWDDQVRLAEWLAAQRVPVLASNQATERILELYGRLGFEITLLDAPRRIASNGDRRPAREMLAMKGL